MTPVEKKSSKSERVFLFAGADDYTTAQKIKAWIVAFEKKYSASGITHIDYAAGDGQQAALAQVLEAGGLFSQTRLAVVKSLFAAKAEQMEPVTEILDRVPDDAYIIFWESAPVKKTLRLYKKVAALEKAGKARIYNFDVPGGAALNQFIRTYALTHKIKMSVDAMEKLAVALGRDLAERTKTSAGYEAKQVFTLWQVAAELDKIGAYAAGETLTAADVAKLVPAKVSDNVFALTAALAEKNPAHAHHVLLSLFEEETGSSGDTKAKAVMMVGALAQQFRSLLQLASALREGGSDSIAGRLLGWSPYRVSANARMLHVFSEKDLRRLLAKLLDLDAALKSTQLPPKLLLSRFFVQAAYPSGAGSA